MAPAERNRLLLASVHDVSPRFESEVDELMGLLGEYADGRVALLVVPDHWGEAPIRAGSPFARRLRRWAEAGSEIFLHGYYHRDEARHRGPADKLRANFMTAGEGEFLGLSRQEATARITKGRALLEGIIDRPVDGFVAPAWLYGPGALEALADAGIPIAEDHLKVWSPTTGKKLASGPVITWASRTRTRLASSLLAARLLRHAPIPVLRVGVHPPDVRHPAILRSVKDTLRAGVRTRRPTAYSALIDQGV